MEGAGLEKSVFAFYMPFIVIYDFRISYLQKILKGYNIAFVSFFLLFPLCIKTGSPVRSEFCNPSLAMVTSLNERNILKRDVKQLYKQSTNHLEALKCFPLKLDNSWPQMITI